MTSTTDTPETSPTGAAAGEPELSAQRFFALAPDLLAIASVREGRWLRVNPAMTTALGWTEAELLAIPLLDLVHPDDRGRWEAATATVSGGAPLQRFEHRLRCRTDDYRWIAWDIAYEAAGHPADGLLYCVGRDVTERRRFEQARAERDVVRTVQLQESMARLDSEVARREEVQRALVETEAALRTVTANAPIALWLTDERGVIRFMAGQAVRATGLDPDQMVGLDVFETYRDNPVVIANLEQALAGEEARRDVTTRNGLVFDTRQVPLRDSRGRVVGTVGVGTDVTEQRRAEAQLREANRTLERQAGELRALATELAGTEHRERRRLAKVLHDHLQQLLVAGKLHAGIAASRAGTAEAVRAAEKVQGLLDQAITASRSLTVELSPPVLHQSGLPAALEWLAGWMAERHGIRVEQSVDPAADPAHETGRLFLFEAVRELLFNVVKHAGVREARIRAAREGETIEVVVEDAGCGCTPSGEPQAEPRGFGLFSVQQRLTHLGGALTIRSAPGQGCAVRIRLPVGAGPPREPRPKTAPVP